MQKIILLVMSILLIRSTAIAQQKLRLGVTYNLSSSTILSTGQISGTAGSSMSMDSGLNWKLNTGTAIRAEYFFNEYWGAYLQTGYQQRGAIYKDYTDDYKPRYRLNYWDVNFGAQFRTKGFENRSQFITNLGITQHTLLSALRVYDTGSDNITDEFNPNNIGVYLGVGGNIPVFGKDIFQVLLFSNYGITQLYSGTFEMNGMTGKNLLMGLQVSYLVGKPSNKE